MIRRLGTHSGKRIYFGYDRYVLPDLEAYLAIMAKNGAEVICAVDRNYLHYLTSAELVCNAVQTDPDSVGILCCGTGLGMSIAANKFKGIYAARCTTAEDAEQCRTINNANVLCLGTKFGLLQNKDMIGAFATAAYSGRKLEELEYITRFELEASEMSALGSSGANVLRSPASSGSAGARSSANALRSEIEKPSSSTIRRTA